MKTAEKQIVPLVFDNCSGQTIERSCKSIHISEFLIIVALAAVLFIVLPGSANPTYATIPSPYELYEAGKMEEAKELAEQLLENDPKNLSLRMLYAEILRKEGKSKQAKEEITKAILGGLRNGYTYSTRGYLCLELGDSEGAYRDFEKALEFDDISEDARENVRLSLINISIRLKDADRALKHLTVRDDPKVFYGIAQLILNTKSGDESRRYIEKIFNLAQSNPQKAEVLWVLGEHEKTLGNVETAAKLMSEARSACPQSATQYRLLSLAYVFVNLGDYQEAAKLFDEALSNDDTASPDVLADAAYAFKRAGNNRKSMEYFTRSIKAYGSRSEDAADIRSKIYSLRRENSDLERRWGMYTSYFYQENGYPGYARGRAISGGKTQQMWQEIYYQMINDNGQKLSLYLSYGLTLSAENDDEGWDTGMYVLGLRYKPISDANLSIALERHWKQDEPNDWQMRMGYSWDKGSDLNVVDSSWDYLFYYGEVAHLLDAGRTFAVAESRIGRSTRLGGMDGRVVFTPHLFFHADYDSEPVSFDDEDFDPSKEMWALSVGPGLMWRIWYREDDYHAPRSYLDVILQYRFKLSDADRAEGLSIRIMNAF
ncbi:tetratricopeptide repeat protein [Acetomicrobium sp.]|uniref:NfrA family protein n=1 Tax=Acetomicrobium sp. TaxID=1872099 RepID=UPI002FCCA2FF